MIICNYSQVHVSSPYTIWQIHPYSCYINRIILLESLSKYLQDPNLQSSEKSKTQMTHLPQVLSSYSVDYHNGRSIITHKKDRETTRETSPAKNTLPKHFNKQRA